MLKLLKIRQAQGLDSLSTEHILHSHPIIYLHLCYLFKSLVIHEFVPDDFGNGVIISLIKGKFSPVGRLYYRAITLIPLISNLFDGALLNIALDLLIFDDLQFGFNKNSSCVNALYTFWSTVDYFNANDSSVYVAALGISKAFDVINHFKISSALINIGILRWIIDLLVNWYSKLKVAVRWINVLSYTFMVSSGVRQGSCLSPSVFNVFTNMFIINVRRAGVG